MNNNELIKNLARLRVADTIINKFEKEYNILILKKKC